MQGSYSSKIPALMTKLAPVQYGTSKNPSILFSMIVVRLCEHRFIIDRLTNVQILVLVLSQLKLILDLSKKSNSNSFNSLMSKMRLRKFLNHVYILNVNSGPTIENLIVYS